MKFIWILFFAGLLGIIFLISKTLNFRNIKGNSNYPITRTVPWIGNDSPHWRTVSLNANFKHEDFNLTNMRSSINIRALFDLNTDNSKFYYLKQLFVNQRYIEDDKKYIAQIEIIPIFSPARPGKDQNIKTYSLILEEPIENRNWGLNYYRIKLGNKVLDLNTHQRK